MHFNAPIHSPKKKVMHVIVPSRNDKHKTEECYVKDDVAGAAMLKKCYSNLLDNFYQLSRKRWKKKKSAPLAQLSKRGAVGGDFSKIEKAPSAADAVRDCASFYVYCVILRPSMYVLSAKNTYWVCLLLVSLS